MDIELGKKVYNIHIIKELLALLFNSVSLLLRFFVQKFSYNITLLHICE